MPFRGPTGARKAALQSLLLVDMTCVALPLALLLAYICATRSDLAAVIMRVKTTVRYEYETQGTGYSGDACDWYVISSITD